MGSEFECCDDGGRGRTRGTSHRSRTLLIRRAATRCGLQIRVSGRGGSWCRACDPTFVRGLGGTVCSGTTWARCSRWVPARGRRARGCRCSRRHRGSRGREPGSVRPDPGARRGRAAGAKARAIGAKLRRRATQGRDQAQAAVRRITGELAGLAERTATEAESCWATPAGRCAAPTRKPPSWPRSVAPTRPRVDPAFRSWWAHERGPAEVVPGQRVATPLKFPKVWAHVSAG